MWHQRLAGPQPLSAHGGGSALRGAPGGLAPVGPPVLSACALRLFAERVSELVQPYARKTIRFLQALRAIGFTAGGEAGARLAQHLHLPTSPPTLLRCVKMLPAPPASPVRVLCADDWAWKRGQRYGTILVDLERHQVVDLLSERVLAGG